ncbi:RtcB family protein [Jannaschia pohangensis]|uniref:3'-phosphate/5'-hydroxy nucleic acid ligase n=1 Tax=Jannaschia pohangensis TaxID=390807 RepID=A0A1I3GDZ7_9RHOB|nr:RtcB family protein [Jannaschia pohangensis]SFI21673.1 release factor H-coupled RctB family protein [Jannaschia pohangensis]
MGNSPIGTGGDVAQLSKFYRAGTWIEGRAEDQLTEVAGWPGMSRIAAFPDLHPGRFGPVGAAFLADRLWPQLVGPDIGCGMALFALDLPGRKLNLDRAARRLRMLEGPDDGADAALAAADIPDLTAMGLGTIGGGNHFCEVQEVAEVAPGAPLATGDLCLLVHSGSRSQGAGIFAALQGEWGAGFAPDSDAGRAYLARHDAAVRWARLNRARIADRAAQALRCQATLICDTSHNHLRETDNGWLHCKGAAEADRGLAPLAGSRDAASYLLAVTGRDPDALGALSHGAGRRYDRAAMHGRMREGRADLAAMTRNALGGRVICEDRALQVEESGRAYKNAAAVVADLAAFDLAHPLATLVPRITFKTARTGGEA